MSESISQTAEIEAKEGIVGFFDILGFQNYIKNDPDVGTKHALETILRIKTDLPKKIKGRISDPIVDEITWSVLSDTVVLSIPYPKSIEGEKEPEILKKRAGRWGALLYSSIALMDHMFDSGLPLRGAISYGKYFVNEQSLAGKSIVDALSTTQKLNLSAAVICPEAEEEFRKYAEPEAYTKKRVKNPPCFPYLVPLKGEMKKLILVNQWALNDNHNNDDIPQLVAQSFWKHEKDMDASALEKFRNTEMLLRYIVAMKREWRR